MRKILKPGNEAFIVKPKKLFLANDEFKMEDQRKPTRDKGSANGSRSSSRHGLQYPLRDDLADPNEERKTLGPQVHRVNCLDDFEPSGTPTDK